MVPLSELAQANRRRLGQSALRTAWQYAYAHTARGDAPLDWHSGFAASRQRLADWVARAGCRPAEHRG